MREALAVRLDAEVRQRLVQTARRRQTSTSALVREAIEAWLAREREQTMPAELMGNLVGCARGGDPRRSAGGGERMAQELADRRRS